MNYVWWAATYPQAAQHLERMVGAAGESVADGHSEAWAQQRDRLTIAQSGGMAWRNNVGATPAKCPDCGAKQRPIRYGLANDSQQLNERIKSSDLIGAIPRLITPKMVGQTIAQFAAIESKRPGWRYTANKRETAQVAWLALITKLGGYATFSTGDLNYDA